MQSLASGRVFAALAMGLLAGGPAAGQPDDEATVAAAVLRIEHPQPLTISRLDLPPEDLGFAGGELATADNMTTGGFMGQSFTLESVSAPPEEALTALETIIEQGIGFVNARGRLGINA